MIWPKPASRTAASLAGSEPASVMVSMPKSAMFFIGAPWPPSGRDELDRKIAERGPRERALSLRAQAVDALVAQRAHGGAHVGRAQCDALQAFGAGVLIGIRMMGRRLDELQHQPARAAQHAAGRQDAESLVVAQRRGAQQPAVEGRPVLDALCAH